LALSTAYTADRHCDHNSIEFSPITMSTSQKLTVILNSPDDWDEWIEVVKTQALAGKV